MTHVFSQVPKAEIQRSRFDRSHSHKTTFDSGYLIPIYVDEALPGDSFNLKVSVFARLATPMHPFMDNLYLDTFFFAVPIRLIWDNWQKFCGEQKNPGDSTDYLTPIMTAPAGGYANGSLSDYFGIPTKVAGFSHTALYHRAYKLMFNEWFRDQNLQNSLVLNTGDGPDNPSDYQVMRRGKRHDYYTSCLPWPQKGPSVELPLGSIAPVMTGLNYTVINVNDDYSGTPKPVNYISRSHTTGNLAVPSLGANVDTNTNMYADLSSATAATINQLRQAFQIQKLYERDARGGTRYIEILKSHFGVTSPDARLQRPEYLGGCSQPFYIKPVPQTSATDANSPQANLAAFGVSSFSGHGFSKSFVEHSIIIGVASVRADLSYQQGLNRMFSRRTRWDYYWPSLSHIGEQAVLNKEIYTQGTLDDDAVFGYQERYAEYRYKPSLITGKFRSNDAQSLDTWHLAQDFGSLPTLNSTFIQENPPVDRVLAVTDEPEVLFDAYFNLLCARPMPVYSVPGNVDRF